LRSWRWAKVCPKHVELNLEINKTVIVASSWSSIFTLPRFITLLHFWVCMASYRMKFGCIIVQFSIALLKIIFISLNFVNNLIVQNITLMSVSLIISKEINLNEVRIWIWSPPKYHMCYTGAVHYYKNMYVHRTILHLHKFEWQSYINANNFKNYLSLPEQTNISSLTYQWLGKFNCFSSECLRHISKLSNSKLLIHIANVLKWNEILFSLLVSVSGDISVCPGLF
jgi:hypothetical protein